MRTPIGSCENAGPAVDRLGLPTPPVAKAVSEGWGAVPADRILHVDTDPAIADPAAFVEHHGAELLDSSAGLVEAWPESCARSGVWFPMG